MTDYTCYNNGIESFLENLSMATDNLSYRELVDHNELMDSIRAVISRADELYALYNPQVIDEHNTSSIAHVDIRQSIQELSAVLESYRTSLSARIDSNVANITAINNDITEIKETNTTQNTNIAANTAAIESISSQGGSSGSGSVVPMTSEEIQAILAATLETTPTRDSGTWLDEGYEPEIAYPNTY